MYIFLSLSFSSSCDLLICEACPFSTLVDLEILGFMLWTLKGAFIRPKEMEIRSYSYMYYIYIHMIHIDISIYVFFLTFLYMYIIHVFQTTPPPFLLLRNHTNHQGFDASHGTVARRSIGNWTVQLLRSKMRVKGF